jgi:hypothetical protein
MIMKLFKVLGLASVASVVATASMASVDVTAATADIIAAAGPVTAIGTAMVGLAVIGTIFKMIRGML